VTAPVDTTLNLAIDGGAGIIDDLRDACHAIETAVDRAAGPLGGTGNPLPRLAIGSWESAAEQAWTALRLVRAGLAEAREVPGARTETVSDVLDVVHAARRDAQRAADGVAWLRWRLAVAEDRIRRDHTTGAARATATRWRAAIRRLDLVTARLAVGVRAVERYAGVLGATEPGVTEPGATEPGVAEPPPPAALGRATAAEIAAGARAAGRAVLAVRPWGGWRGFWAHVRHETRTDLARERGVLRNLVRRIGAGGKGRGWER
jgi:hypothetical protein